MSSIKSRSPRKSKRSSKKKSKKKSASPKRRSTSRSRKKQLEVYVEFPDDWTKTKYQLYRRTLSPKHLRKNGTMISYNLAGPEAYSTLFGMNEYQSLIIPFWFVYVSYICFGKQLIQPSISCLTFFKCKRKVKIYKLSRWNFLCFLLFIYLFV